MAIEQRHWTALSLKQSLMQKHIILPNQHHYSLDLHNFFLKSGLRSKKRFWGYSSNKEEEKDGTSETAIRKD